MDTSPRDGVVPSSPREWRDYLAAYAEEFLRTANEYERSSLDETRLATCWLGRPPAGERTIAAAQERLGVRFPPSFRGFLQASDGWDGVGGWVDKIYPCGEVEWFGSTQEGQDYIELYNDLDGDEAAAVFQRSLVIAGGEDYWLLDPAVVADGEWAAYEFEPKYGQLTEFTSFHSLMEGSRKTMTILGGDG